MPKISLSTLCLVTAVLYNTVERSLEHEIPRRSFLSRRAIDGTRGRKYFDPNEDGAFDSYGSAGGEYDPYDYTTDLSDIRKNVPGEPGVDYPAYTTLPQTGFTCEGRSRGYYADEAAGCQVFHVCHDVLVSSFLCPIGSTFSQKLLTCDWWTKVDCSSSNRYLEKNRNSYQIDDDEMIRKAYAMISLQSSTEEVTKDGLVDPDSGARIVDYPALSGRIVMGFLPGGFRRITNYAPVDATKNDLPSGFENYPRQDERRIFNYDNQQQKSTNPAYHEGKVHFENKDRSPYHASLIIRHDYQDRVGDNEFQDDYGRSNSRFANRLQTSYAPTVPTITTTTRRFYSPTVPTTYRPSTLAYNKLDLIVDSSDHLYAHSKTPVTSPTFTHQNEDVRNADLRERETETSKKSENASRTDRDNKKNDSVHSENDQMHFNFEEKSEANVRINMTGVIDEDVQIFRQQNDRPITKPDTEDSLEDIETKDSIGIVRALNHPLGMIMQSQNPVKNERTSLTTSILPQSISNHFSGLYEKEEDVNSLQTSKKSEISNETKYDQSAEEDTTSLTTKSFEERTYTRSFGDKTTPLLRNWQQNVNAAQASTISATAKSTISTTRRSVYSDIVRSSTNDSYITVDQNMSSTRSISNSNDDSISRLNLSFEIPQPARFLRPPVGSFFINVPEETHYTTIDESSKTSWNPESTNTEIPRFSDTPIAINQDRSPIFNVEEHSLVDYTDDLSQTTNLGIHLTVQPIAEVPTSIPWLVPPSHDRAIVDVPVTNIVPPILDYNDGFGDFVPPKEHAYAIQSDHTENIDSQKIQNFSMTPKNNNSEIETLIQYNTGFQFTIRDAVKAQLDSRVNSRLPCYSSTSDKQGKHCEIKSAVIAPKVAISTPSVEATTISIGTKATLRISERFISSSSTNIPGNAATFILDESLTSTTQSPITVSSNIDIERSNLKTVIPKSILEINVSEEKTKKNATESSLSRSIHPESLKQIEETIDKHNSPYEISFTVKRDENLESPDDFISRLIAQHQQSASIPKDELDDFEIIRSIEPADEVADISMFHDASHASLNNKDNSFPVVVDDTIGQFKQSNSNMSMLNLLQLMAELLKLDRLPRPFSAKDLRSAELRDSFNLDLDEQPDATTSPLLIRSQARTAFKNTKPKVSAFDTLKTPVNITKLDTSLNLNVNEPSFVTTSSLLEARLPIGKNADSKISFLEDTLRAPINIPIKPLPDVSSRINSNNNATKQKTSQLKAENKTRPLQKQEILEQLTENFGQPLYRDNSIRGPLVFDLPQVQRSLDFETGLPIEESKHVISEAEKISLASFTTGTTTTMTQESTTTMTTESVKTIVETEFVPSLGFSFDTNEDREEYVQAVLEGLINERTDEDSNKESSRSQLTNRVPKNETSSPEQYENSKDT
ncbi:serine-rich adhesin for platelets [Polyergus mexicanus]|uniref:serine-rich adhesin for platelets n=1 Tax=Polyergus mexicanus TaxID=615972 RepID=UPI0038B41CAE